MLKGTCNRVNFLSVDDYALAIRREMECTGSWRVNVEEAFERVLMKVKAELATIFSNDSGQQHLNGDQPAMNPEKSFGAASACSEGDERSDKSVDELGSSNKEEYTVGDNSCRNISKEERDRLGEGTNSKSGTRPTTERRE